MKKLVKIISGLVITLSLSAAGAQVASAAEYEGIGLTPAQELPTSPAIKKGQSIVVTVKDTKKQTVPVYNQNAEKTNKSVKMGNEYTAKAVKKVNGKKIVKVSSSKWLNAKDVTQN